ncbi:MAG: DUF6798 domain-containing protein [Pirellulaceae bacterium]|nr:hypothetical protein [Planctomycetales bacterium]
MSVSIGCSRDSFDPFHRQVNSLTAISPHPSFSIAAGGELLLMLMLCFVYAGGAVPAVNEAHYVAKAKHYWQPEWGDKDFFLESADAHVAFYWSIGWLTKYVSLTTTTWIGRLAAWSLIVTGWFRLTRSMLPQWGTSLLTLALTICGWHYAHMAGEWVVGGIEGKSLAYGLVFWGLAALARNQWRWTWILFGGASAFHVLVGGWCVILAGLVWLSLPLQQRPSIRSMLPALVIGFVISLLGLLPALALNRDVDTSVAREANHIYAFLRLPHHLLFHRFQTQFVTRHLALFLGLSIVGLLTVHRNASLSRVVRFAIAAGSVAGVGAILDLALLSSPETAASLLRYYWFRLSDAMLPVAVALAIVWLTLNWSERSSVAQWGIVLMMGVAVLGIGDVARLRMQDRRPAADAQRMPVDPQFPEQAWLKYGDWRAACAWIAAQTPPHANFLTPATPQTFKWYTGRSEVFNHKDIPQDAAGIVEWNRRRLRYNELDLYDDEEINLERLRAFCRYYVVDYVIVDRSRAVLDLPFPVVYENDSYRILWIPPAEP